MLCSKRVGPIYLSNRCGMNIMNIMTEMWDAGAFQWDLTSFSESPRDLPCVDSVWVTDMWWSRHTLDCSLLQSTHQHHDRDVKRRCLSMTLSRMGSNIFPRHRRCNQLINTMTEMWDTCALEWRCRESHKTRSDYVCRLRWHSYHYHFTHQPHDRDVRHTCIRTEVMWLCG